MTDLTDRPALIAAWWAGLDEGDRRVAREVAETGAYLPDPMATGLIRANVLLSTDGYWTSVDSGPRGFPMPEDVRAFVLKQTD